VTEVCAPITGKKAECYEGGAFSVAIVLVAARIDLHAHGLTISTKPYSTGFYDAGSVADEPGRRNDFPLLPKSGEGDRGRHGPPSNR